MYTTLTQIGQSFCNPKFQYSSKNPEDIQIAITASTLITSYAFIHSAKRTFHEFMVYQQIEEPTPLQTNILKARLIGACICGYTAGANIAIFLKHMIC